MIIGCKRASTDGKLDFVKEHKPVHFLPQASSMFYNGSPGDCWYVLVLLSVLLCCWTRTYVKRMILLERDVFIYLFNLHWYTHRYREGFACQHTWKCVTRHRWTSSSLTILQMYYRGLCYNLSTACDTFRNHSVLPNDCLIDAYVNTTTPRSAISNSLVQQNGLQQNIFIHKWLVFTSLIRKKKKVKSHWTTENWNFKTKPFWRLWV